MLRHFTIAKILESLAGFHVGPGWAPVGPSWARVGPRLGLTGAHLGMLLGMPCQCRKQGFVRCRDNY